MSFPDQKFTRTLEDFETVAQEMLLQQKAGNQLSADHLEVQRQILSEQRTANLIAFAKLQHDATGATPNALITRIREQTTS